MKLQIDPEYQKVLDLNPNYRLQRKGSATPPESPWERLLEDLPVFLTGLLFAMILHYFNLFP